MIQEHTFNFLKNLREHNDRMWFHSHKKDYEIARKNFMDELDTFTKLAEKVDVNIDNAEAEKHMFRINRDVRFSKSKLPYKAHMSGYVCPG